MIFGKNINAYTLFESLLYIVNSKNNIKNIDDKISESKILYSILDDSYLRAGMRVQEKKTEISSFIRTLELYEKNIFDKKPKINIEINENVPRFLVMDETKVKSALFHFILDMHLHLGIDDQININISYSDDIKEFNLELSSKLKGKVGLLNLFKSKKNLKEEKERINLRFAKHLISKIKGDLNIDFVDDIYVIKITIPVLLIKI